MTAPLNKAIDCCDSEVDGEIAGLAVLYEHVLVAVPATTVLSTLDIFICCFVETLPQGGLTFG